MARNRETNCFTKPEPGAKFSLTMNETMTNKIAEETESVAEFRYAGGELDIFAAAFHWKLYWSERIRPYLRGDTLEVGAGIGSNTSFLSPYTPGRWVCLEPDPGLSVELGKNLAKMPRTFENLCGILRNLSADDQFDTIVYIDVLEHIEDDGGELSAAAAKLRRGGRVVVLSPAHQFLFTPFDVAIGHFRRYNKSSLRKISPAGLQLEAMFYLDSIGVFASAANRLLLKQSMPTKEQIGVWDRWIVPASRVLDPILRYSVGKSIVGVWRKPSEDRNPA